MRFIVMQAFFGAAALIVGFSTASSAASLSVAANKLTYTVGETVTLSVTGDDESASAYAVFGRLDYSSAFVGNGTRSQTQLVGQNGNWIKGPLSAFDNGTIAYSYAFDTVVCCAVADTALNLPGTVSVVTLIAQAVGVVNVNWHTTGDAETLDFFGLINAPGTSFTIVPEPGTTVLFSIGLLGLAGWRRRRE